MIFWGKFKFINDQIIVLKEYERIKRKEKTLFYRTTLKAGHSTKYIETKIGIRTEEKSKLDIKREEKSIEHFLKIWDNLAYFYDEPQAKFRYLSEQETESVLNNLRLVEVSRAIYKIMLKILENDELESIEKQMFHRHVYGTTQIEGNPLHYEAVQTVLESGKTLANYDINDINEIDKFETLRQNLKKIPAPKIASESTIKKIHQILMDGLYRISHSPYDKKRTLIKAGVYRTMSVIIGNSLTQTSKPEDIKKDLSRLIKEYHENNNNNINAIETIAFFHQQFERIHPFEDGNGRTGREVLNLMLLAKGYPPIYLRKEDNKNYYDALQEADLKNYLPLMNFIIKRIDASLFFYFSKTYMYTILKSKKCQAALKLEKGFVELMEYYQTDKTVIP